MADEENEWPGQEIKNIGKEVDLSEELEQKYRHILLMSEMGQDVFIDTLINFCHVGQFLEYNQAQIAEHNMSVSLLIRCKIFDKDNIRKSLRKLLSG